MIGGFESFSSYFRDQCDSSTTNSSASSFQQQQQQQLSKMGPPTVGGAFNLCLNGNSGLASKRPNLRLNNLPMGTPSLGPFTAPMPQFENQAFNPFFSNIRQNMELSHGPIRERFPVRLPAQCNVDPSHDYTVQVKTEPRCVAGGHLEKDASFKAPQWLHSTIKENGAQILAETYEVIMKESLIFF